MRRHLPVALPWIFLLLLVAIVAWDQLRSREVEQLATPLPALLAATQGDSTGPIARDPVCGMEVRKRTAYQLSTPDGSVHFCSTFCRDEFRDEPARSSFDTPVAGHTMRGIPTWMYQVGIAGLLVFSVLFLKSRDTGGDPRATLASSPRWDIMGRSLRLLLKSGRMTLALQLLLVVIFLAVIMAGLFGNQNPTRNIAPLVTWTIWWVGLVLLILYVGKAWCYVCPWNAIATWAERLSLRGPGTSLGLGRKWPRMLRSIWPAVGLFVALTWIEIGMGVTMIPWATALLGLIILFMAIASAFIFERKAFCRYACLVGRVSGLYAMFSSLELRAQDTDVCASCKTSDCYKGNERGESCPTSQYLGTMQVSTYCTLCSECIKTCPHDNVTLRLRPWGEDLLTRKKSMKDEGMLALIMLSLTAFHGLTMTPVWHQIQAGLGMPRLLGFSVLMLAINGVLILSFMALAQLSAWLGRSRGANIVWLDHAYAILPIALFYHLAHNAEHFLMEAPRIVPLLSDPFGRGWNLFGTAQWKMGPLITLEGLWVIQVLMVLVGHIFALWVSDWTMRKAAPGRSRTILAELPLFAAMILLSVISLWLLQLPMEMRH